MNASTPPRTRARTTRRLDAAMLGLALAACSAGSMAQTTTVEVGPNLIQSILNQINTYMQRYQDQNEYAEQLQRWQQTYDHYQQQLVRMRSITTVYRLPQGRSMEEVADDYLVERRCGGGGGSSLGRLLDVDPEGDIVAQQKQVCASIQAMENRKYNETIRFLRDTVPGMERSLDAARGRRDSSNDEGNLTASQDDSARIANELGVKFEAWGSRIQMYDAYIAALKDNQRVLAGVAMKGESHPLGTVVRAAALKRALDRD